MLPQKLSLNLRDNFCFMPMNIKNDREIDFDDLEKDEIENDVFFQNQIAANHLEYRFYDEIGDPKKYINLIRKLQNTTENDTVNFHFCCDGGRMDAMMCILSAIRRSPATIIGHLDSHAASAASIIFLSCDRWMLTTESSLMLHDFSGGLIGKGNEMSSQLTHYISNFKILMNNVCTPFVSSREIDQICSGTDMWFNNTEITRRLTILGNAREANANALAKAAAKRKK